MMEDTDSHQEFLVAEELEPIFEQEYTPDVQSNQTAAYYNKVT